MIIIKYKEIYLTIDSNLYIYCLLTYLTALNNKQFEYYLFVLLRQAISNLNITYLSYCAKQ